MTNMFAVSDITKLSEHSKEIKTDNRLIETSIKSLPLNIYFTHCAIRMKASLSSVHLKDL